MDFLTIIVVAYLLLKVKTKVTNLEDAKDYLKHYEYIGNDSLTDFETAIMNFQERYNLFVDGELNNEMLDLMNRPRCEEGENSFRVTSKWNKTHLSWYFPQATNGENRKLVERAFKFWQENSNLKFFNVLRPSPIKPDITITVQRREHFFRANCQGQYKCPEKFDGVGTILAHGYSPQGDKCREIHMDADENWFFGADGHAPMGQSSFLMTLVHEIGHVLGLAHSDVSSAVMFPWYQENITSLSQDDIMALEYLYGPKVSTSTVSMNRVPSTRTSSIPTTERVNQNSSKEFLTKTLCELQYPDVIFLAYAPEFPNHRLYVMFENFLWRIDVKSRKIPEKPEDVRSYLPKELQKVTHIFQDATGNLFVANENKFYSVSFPDLNIQEDIQLKLPKGSRVNGIFQSNTGRNFIWYNNASFIEFSMNDFQILNRGLIRDMFPGAPEGISSVFRYIDGHLYFFRKNIYYKYNEFKRELLEAGPFNWNILRISCPDKWLLEQLKSVLAKILEYYE